MTRADLGGDSGEFDRQVTHVDVGERRLKFLADAVAGEDAGAGEGQIEQADDATPVEREREILDLGEAPGGVEAADDRADRCADDDIRADAHRVELFENADMAPATRGAGAKRDADFRTSNGLRGSLGHGWGRTAFV